MISGQARRVRTKHDIYSSILSIVGFLVICVVYFGDIRGPVGGGLLVAAFFSGLSVYRRGRSSNPWL